MGEKNSGLVRTAESSSAGVRRRNTEVVSSACTAEVRAAAASSVLPVAVSGVAARSGAVRNAARSGAVRNAARSGAVRNAAGSGAVQNHAAGSFAVRAVKARQQILAQRVVRVPAARLGVPQVGGDDYSFSVRAAASDSSVEQVVRRQCAAVRFGGKERVRNAFAGFCVAAALALGAVAWVTSSSATASAAAGENNYGYTVVLPGDTLWDLATRIADGADPRDVVLELRRLNDLGAAELTAYKPLAVPLKYSEKIELLTAAELGYTP